MTPEEVGGRLVAVLPAPVDIATEAAGGTDAAAGTDAPSVAASVSGGGGWARATVDVPPASWRAALLAARDDAELSCDFFDWLSAVDDPPDGFSLVAHVWSTRRRHGVLVRTRVPRDAPSVASVVDVFPGAAWHERETHEMFGVDFPGHPGLTPLLLPPEFEGHPLRKEFVLAARVAKDWPGAKEPGESHDPTAARRQKMRPPGVPDPTEWGPDARPPTPPPAGLPAPPAGSATAQPDAGPSAAGDGEG
jgi:NADH-quinone oxidoreductase subunit C